MTSSNVPLLNTERLFTTSSLIYVSVLKGVGEAPGLTLRALNQASLKVSLVQPKARVSLRP